MSLSGFNIIESPLVQPIPKLQLRHDFKWCSESFRQDMNTWLLEMFGTKEVCYIFNGKALGLYGNGIFMNPKQAAMIRNFTS